MISIKAIKFYKDCNVAKQGEMYKFIETKCQRYYYVKPDAKVEYVDECCRGDSYGIIDVSTPIERLKFGIIQECYLLNMNISKVSQEIKNMEKDKLLEYFIELKELLLQQRESEIIDFLISSET